MINHEVYELMDDAKPLMKKFDRQINSLSKTVGITDYEAATTAILLDNTERAIGQYRRRKNLSDATFSENVGPFLKHAMNIVSTMYTTFELKDLISVQPMKQRIGALYFLNYLYSSNKGRTREGDTIFSATRKGTPNGMYSSEEIERETIIGTYNDTDQTYTFTTAYYPIFSNRDIRLSISGGGSAAGGWTLENGVFTNGSATGVVNYSNGTVVLNNVTAPVTASHISYSWNSEHNRNLIPKVSVQVQEELVQATRRTMMFEVSLDATIDYQNQFNRDLNSEVESAVLREIQNELGYYILDKLILGADTTRTFEWNSTRPEEISLQNHYQSLFKMLSEMSTYLYTNMGRGKGNNLVVGADFAAICDSLPDTVFKAESVASVRGPHKLGVLLNKFTVYFNPAYADDEFIMLYKGQDWWEAPYFIGSYLPLMASKFMMFPDFHGEQGYISMEAHRYLFPKHVIKGKITQ